MNCSSEMCVGGVQGQLSTAGQAGAAGLLLDVGFPLQGPCWRADFILQMVVGGCMGLMSP